LIRHFKNDEDARTVVNEIEAIVSDKFDNERESFVLKPELLSVRNDIALLRQEIKTGFAESESRMRGETNKLILWIIAIIFSSGALFITLAKVFFDK
jgi:hypothetical protein